MTTQHKGIILAESFGNRLPLATSEQMVPVCHEPIGYCPNSSLMFASMRDILSIRASQKITCLRPLLGEVSQWGLILKFAMLASPNGFIIGDQVPVLLRPVGGGQYQQQSRQRSRQAGNYRQRLSKPAVAPSQRETHVAWLFLIRLRPPRQPVGGQSGHRHPSAPIGISDGLMLDECFANWGRRHRTTRIWCITSVPRVFRVRISRREQFFKLTLYLRIAGHLIDIRY